MATIVDATYADIKALLAFLDQEGEVSLRSLADNNFKKVFLLSAASFFETEIQDIITAYATGAANNDERLLAFVKSTAIARKYFTYFAWRGTNANSFFGLFGETFAESCKAAVQIDPSLKESIAVFLELGNLRNELAHLNFAAFPMEKTTDELYEQYKIAQAFVDFLRARLAPSK